LDLGLQKSLGDSWKAKLIAQDVFHTNRFVGEGITAEFIQTYRIIIDTRIVLLNLTYSFGNQQLKKTRQRRLGAEEELQRSN